MFYSYASYSRVAISKTTFILPFFFLQYIRKLLFSDLDKSTIEQVLRQLRKLPWSECEPYLLKCFMKVHKGRYGQIHLVASLTAGLSRYHDEFAVAVVDEVRLALFIYLFFFYTVGSFGFPLNLFVSLDIVFLMVTLGL